MENRVSCDHHFKHVTEIVLSEITEIVLMKSISENFADASNPGRCRPHRAEIQIYLSLAGNTPFDKKRVRAPISARSLQPKSALAAR